MTNHQPFVKISTITETLGLCSNDYVQITVDLIKDTPLHNLSKPDHQGSTWLVFGKCSTSVFLGGPGSMATLLLRRVTMNITVIHTQQYTLIEQSLYYSIVHQKIFKACQLCE